ncbi:MAG: pentapeptide repeat-containing protein [Pseudomonadota bacterium]
MKRSTKNFFYTTACLSVLFAAFSAANVPVAVSQASCSSTASPGVNWEGCRKRNLIMAEFDFSGSNFSKTDLSSSDLRNSNLSGSNLFKANLVRASLMGVKANAANFSGAIAYRTDFSGSKFADVNFSKAEILRANFSGTEILNSDMSKGEFSRVNFSGAKVMNVNFDFSNLARSDFRGAQIVAPISMTGAYLFRTRFEGVDLSSVDGLEDWQLKMACGNASTKLPAGFAKPDTWPCVEETD